ncbi:MAG: hypothetical protein GY940_34415 [bacterium]|nr:hypothetical protein [bacterium]
MMLRYLLICLGLFYIVGSGLHAAIPASERAALIALYNATDGDNWTKKDGWKDGALEPDGFGPPGSEGDWEGIVVSGDYVSKILLSDNNLTGSLPPELGNLTRLIRLYLHTNRLSGSIPSELAKMSSLDSLHLGKNRLSGIIPPELGNMTNLTALGLSSNKLSGGIPSSLMTLTDCDFLRVRYNALYTGNETLRDFLTDKDSFWQRAQTIAPLNVTATSTSESSIRVSWTPVSYTKDPGSYRVYYSTKPGPPWKHYGEAAGKGVSVYDATGLDSGTMYYFKVQTQTDAHANNKNTVLSEYSPVVSAVTEGTKTEKNPPFGSFDTPIEGLTARGSIPVTGWALDDSGIDTVKIYRELGNQLVYIGDGVFIEGARPDVATAYPTYPGNTKAGWGYMLLTNFLPAGGNGTFVLHAVATDLVGISITLGTKTIQCDNANAVKPFGAIDTPTQGGSASGTGFVNFGWTLTPQPNTIPVDGSTITVWVDGVALGNPVYNKYRGDIAALFPNYNNSNGAIGYFYLDTTGYTNSVHTIQWTVKDDAGNFDGIGSRYFTINNNQNRGQSQTQSMHDMDVRIHDIPLDTMSSLNVKTGYNPEHFNKEKRYRLDEYEPARIEIEIPELGRVELHLIDETGEEEIEQGVSFMGYQWMGNGLRPLPIGSYLDKSRGIFYWQSGVAFLGDDHLVFIKTDGVGNRTRHEVTVTIKPQQ